MGILQSSHGKSTTLGSFSKLFIKRGLFSNYLSRESVFICIAPKAEVQFNEKLTCDIELSTAMRNGLLQLLWRNHFWTGFASMCSVDCQC